MPARRTTGPRHIRLFVQRIAATTPVFFIHGDMKPRSASRLAILPDTTHVTLMQRMPIIVPMVNDFLDAKP